MTQPYTVGQRVRVIDPKIVWCGELGSVHSTKWEGVSIRVHLDIGVKMDFRPQELEPAAAEQRGEDE